MRALVVFVVLAASFATSRIAWAGWCDVERGTAQVKELEAFAKNPKAKALIAGICVEQSISTTPKLRERFLAACATIFARDPKQTDCVKSAIDLGETKLGDLELFDQVEKLFDLDPFKFGNLPVHLYEKLDDARAVPILLARWKAVDDKHAASKSESWLHWRLGAVRIFGKHGGADERAFLAGLAVKDKKLAKAITKAIADIDAR